MISIRLCVPTDRKPLFHAEHVVFKKRRSTIIIASVEISSRVNDDISLRVEDDVLVQLVVWLLQ